MATNVKNLALNIQSGTTDVLYASWTISAKNVDKYKVSWIYYTGDKDKKNKNVWFDGGSSEVTRTNATYNIPSNATVVQCTVKPISKTYKKSGKTRSYWTGGNTKLKYYVKKSPPATPSAPNVEIDKYTLKATLENIEDANTDKITFQVYKDSKAFGSPITSAVKAGSATGTCTITVGGYYTVRCKAINNDGNLESDWSNYSSSAETIPADVSNVKCTPDDETTVKVTWTGSTTATSYEIQYTTESKYFDTTSGVSSTTVESTTGYVTGLDSGHKWYFRVRAKNSVGYSGWSSIVSTIIGSTPSAPTTWSLSNTIMATDPAVLYWTHNSEDGSRMTTAEIKYTIGSTTKTIVYTNTASEDEDEYVYSYTLDLSSYTAGTEVLWQVRTKGIIDTYSDWSTQRTLTLYAPPTVTLIYEDTLTSMPYSIEITAGPSTQTALVYHVSIVADETYETEDEFGNVTVVNADTEIFSKIYTDSGNSLTIELDPGDISLESGCSYTLKVTVAMDSGLTGEGIGNFTVDWLEDLYNPDAEVSIDEEALCAYLTPFCEDEEENLVEGAVLTVYRREYDGSFTKIAENIANDKVTTVTDPHPALDHARYRIVARSTSNGSIGYSDLPAMPIEEPSVVIQWDEAWTDFDYDEESAPVEPVWKGSMVRIPYNIDTSEKHDPDVSLIEYIGRKHPVSYYGTQRGESASWSFEVPKTDKETVYALRRLAVWPGDVYVREPSGVGYWAHITVSLSMKHKDLTVPVTIDITRVEGGI